MRHQQFAQLQRACYLDLGVAVPGFRAATVAVFGQLHFGGRVGLAEPGHELLALSVQQAGVVHLDADGVVVQAIESIPLAHAGVPGHAVERRELHDAAVASEHDVRRGVALRLLRAQRFHRAFQVAPGGVVHQHEVGAQGATHIGRLAKRHVGPDQAVALDAQHASSPCGLNGAV